MSDEKVSIPQFSAPERKPASMESLIRSILYCNVDNISIDVQGMDMETEIVVTLNNGKTLFFEDCMLDGAVRRAAEALGVSNWEDGKP
jgi:hypothetical protein